MSFYGLSTLQKNNFELASKLFVTAKKELSESLVLFLSIAKASRAEVETQLLICQRLEFLNEEITKNAFKLCDEIKRMIIAILKNINNGNI